MSRRPTNAICIAKHCFPSRHDAELVVARWKAMDKLRYPVNVYCCPLSGTHWHIGRARRRLPS